MAYTVHTTPLPDVLRLEPAVFSDARGQFFESFNQREFAACTGLDLTFVQDNHSRSLAGVLRGMHYQRQHPQGKLVRVVAGEIYDVAVDLRRSSKYFGHWAGTRLSAQNRQQLWIPPGFAHGYLCLSETADVLYKATDYWSPGDECIMSWNDPDIGIVWPLEGRQPILAPKDAAGSAFRSLDTYP